MIVPADLPAHGRWIARQLHGNGSDAATGLQEVRDRDPFGLREKPGGDHGRLLTGDGSVPLDVSGFLNHRAAVWSLYAGITTDPHDPARFGIAHSLFHQLMIGAHAAFFGKAPRVICGLHFAQLQLLNSSVPRPMDAKPSPTHDMSRTNSD